MQDHRGRRMRRFFDLTFLPFFVFTGAITALGAVNAFWYKWAVEKIVLIPFNEDYTIILRHWGFMLGLMGVFMIIAAFSAAWRYPILIFCALEKAFAVYLIAVNWNRPYARGLWGAAAMDAAVVLYIFAILMVRGFTKPSPR